VHSFYHFSALRSEADVVCLLFLDQNSVRLLAVEGCAALGKLLEPQDCVAHIFQSLSISPRYIAPMLSRSSILQQVICFLCGYIIGSHVFSCCKCFDCTTSRQYLLCLIHGGTTSREIGKEQGKGRDKTGV
jgi:predicted DNA-binding ArsR family transcriptional regulator